MERSRRFLWAMFYPTCAERQGNETEWSKTPQLDHSLEYTEIYILKLKQ